MRDEGEVDNSDTNCQSNDRHECLHRKKLRHLRIPDKNKRNVDQDDQVRQIDIRQRIDKQRYTYCSAIQEPIGKKETFQSKSRRQNAQRNKKRILYDARYVYPADADFL